MKYYLLFSFLFFVFVGQSQTKKDSTIIYRQELNKLWKTTIDSFKNSERFKFLQTKTNNGKSDVRIELAVNYGIYFTDFTNLNSRLQSLGQDQIKNGVQSVGISFAVGYPIMTYGFEWSAYIGQNNGSNTKGMHGKLYLGTHIFKKSRIVLHPQIGYAPSLMNLYIYKNQGQTDFNNIFSTQSNVVQLKQSTNYIDFGLGFKFKSPKDENMFWQFLKVGYRMGLKDANWTMEKGELTNAPTDRNNQFYFQLCLGFDR